MPEEFGHVKISRKAYKCDPWWLEKRVFSKWEAWEWLIQEASWDSRQQAAQRAGVIHLERGETPPLAERFLADTWGWSRRKVRSYLEDLHLLGRVKTTKRTAVGCVYLLVNYDRYQSAGTTKRTTKNTDRGPNKKAVNADGSDKSEPGEARPRSRVSDLRAWAPNDGHRALALAEGLDVVREEAKFRAFAANREKPFRDLDAGFIQWLLRAKSFSGHRNSSEKPPPDEQTYDPTNEFTGLKK